MADFKIGCSPLSGRIFAGTVKKDGTWRANKKDVTDTAPSAVAQHFMDKAEAMIFWRDGKRYIMEVREFPEEKTCNHSCGPGDFRKGGKCDEMGCYED